MTQRKGSHANEFRSWRKQDWPIPDQEKWSEAFGSKGLLRSRSSAVHLCIRSQQTLEQAYGLFLDHVARHAGRSCLQRQNRPAAVVSPTLVESYDNELRGRVGSVTRYEYISKLRRAAGILDPDKDLRWLRELERRLASVRQPADKRHRVVESQVLLAAGFRLMEQHTHHPGVLEASRFRNGLMIALLSVCPIRLRNFARLTIGADFRQIGASWWITLPAASTKTRRGDDRIVPELLSSAINTYTNFVRPRLKPVGKQMWIGSSGRPLTYGSVQHVITRSVEDEIGIAVSPHLFRTCAATTAYLLAPQYPDLASILLQHSNRSITQKHYNKAPSTAYTERFRMLVEE